MNGPLPPGFVLHQGACFRYPVPPDWQVAEDGQFAVVLVPPDRQALAAVLGNVGLPTGYPPHQYLYEKLMGLHPEGLQFSHPRPGPPLAGFAGAWDFDLYYSIQGRPCQGWARVHLAPAYDTCTLALTWVAAEASQWPSYATWLPNLPLQIEVTHPAAFGAQALAQQNLANSVAYGQQAQAHREWSQATWAEVQGQRDAVQDQQAADFRQALAGTQRYDNPYTGQSIDLPASQQAYWVHPVSGQIVGDPNPSFDPRTPSDPGWRRLVPISHHEN